MQRLADKPLFKNRGMSRTMALLEEWEPLLKLLPGARLVKKRSVKKKRPTDLNGP
jgi:hypothetical protein